MAPESVIRKVNAMTQTRSIVITGAATGIGLATAARLDNAGWRVFGTALPGQSTAELKTACSDRLEVLELDVTDTDSVRRFADQVAAAVGDDGLDALHNNAGVADIASGLLAGIDMGRVRQIFEINAFGMLRVIQALLPLLHAGPRPGRIINMSSSNARVPVPIAGPYMMTKCAVEALTRTLRLELAAFDVEVVAIEPGAVRTPMTADADAGIEETWSRMPEAVRARYESWIRPANERLLRQLQTLNEPDDIAATVERALHVKRPRPRYVAGKEVRPLPWLERLLPERTLESLLLKTYGIRRGAARRRKAPGVRTPQAASDWDLKTGT